MQTQNVRGQVGASLTKENYENESDERKSGQGTCPEIWEQVGEKEHGKEILQLP